MGPVRPRRVIGRAPSPCTALCARAYLPIHEVQLRNRHVVACLSELANRLDHKPDVLLAQKTKHVLQHDALRFHLDARFDECYHVVVHHLVLSLVAIVVNA